jgi:hypothetical protein
MTTGSGVAFTNKFKELVNAHSSFREISIKYSPWLIELIFSMTGF